MSQPTDGAEPPRAPGPAPRPPDAPSPPPGAPAQPPWDLPPPAWQPDPAQPGQPPWNLPPAAWHPAQPGQPTWQPDFAQAGQPGPGPAAYPYPGLAPVPFLRSVRGAAWFEAEDLRFAGALVAVLAVVGAITGWLWSAISPHSRGIVIPGLGVIPDETESFVAADGRYALLTGAIGLVAGIIVWSVPRRRGPMSVAALGVGALLASVLTAVVGHVLSSGRATGSANTVITLRITLHAHGLLLLGPALALLAYLVGVLLARPDDLGRPAGGATGPPTLAGGYPVPGDYPAGVPDSSPVAPAAHGFGTGSTP